MICAWVLFLLCFQFNRQALLSVAETFFENVDLGGDQIKVKIEYVPL